MRLTTVLTRRFDKIHLQERCTSLVGPGQGFLRAKEMKLCCITVLQDTTRMCRIGEDCFILLTL